MLIWLQGGSSIGKSSIARGMLAAARTGEAWFHSGDDHLIAGVPQRLIAPEGPGRPAHRRLVHPGGGPYGPRASSGRSGGAADP
jgi:chloramphenicol 3-O-phosphotransferase